MIRMLRLVEAATVFMCLHYLLSVDSAKPADILEDDVFSTQRHPAERMKLRKHQHFASSSSKDRKPNIILFLTDDQDVELGSLNYMPRTLQLLRDGGAELRHAYTTTPMCCPSRSSLLTGLYMHNHHVYTNNDNCSSPHWQATHETRSFATFLSNAGYRTGYFGKYLNKYNGSYIPPGWREWGGLIMNSRYYNYSINLNGKKVKHGDDYYKDYFPDLIVNDSISFLRQSKQYFSRKPVMLVLSFPAPHGPEDSAPQYSNMFFNVTTHHTPSYDYAPNSDKQWILQVTGKMQPIHRQFTDLLMTKRLQTLQSVDVAVEKVYQELKALGELDNTYMVYTSDHGYHLGQFGLVKGKSFPFEFDIRVPFLIRGPGIEPGSTVENVVLNIDLAPTFLAMAGVDPPPHMDGRSFYPLLFRRSRLRESLSWPDTFLIESSGRRESSEIAAEMKLQESLSDMEKDLTRTLEQVAIAEDPQLDNQVSVVVTGSKLERIALECQRPELQSPCRPGQKWQCISEDNRWRKHKCKLRPVLPRTKGRKCACFTPSGVMYTKLESDDFTSHRLYVRGDRREEALSMRAGRTARKTSHNDSERNDLLFALSSRSSGGEARWTESELANKYPRIKRHTGVLDELLSVRDKILNFQDPENGSADLNCTVDSVKDVSCSDSVYRSPEHWRATQQRLEQEIRKLRTQLEKLKEIKRFLKEKTPYNRNSGDSDEDIEGSTELHRVKEDDFFGKIFDEEEVLTAPTTERSVWKHGMKNKNRFYDFGVNGTISGDVRRNVLKNGTQIEIHETDSGRIAKRRKHKLVSENTEINTLSRHRHRHKSEPEGRTTTAASAASLPLPDTATKKDWPGPGPGRIDVTILEPVLSQTHSRRPADLFPPDTCFCDPYLSSDKDEKDIAREARRRMKEERLRRKERKLRRKAKLESECLSEKMNCFNHDNQHWRTPPFWTEGSFCFCMNANNNTYSCLRTINKTHNFLYCEFITGLVTFYNLRLDPFEQWNRASLLTPDERSYMHDTLVRLKACRGVRQCTIAVTSHRQSSRRGRPPTTTTTTAATTPSDAEDKENEKNS